MRGISLLLQRRINDLDQNPWVAFVWRLLLVVACSRIWHNRLVLAKVPTDGSVQALMDFATTQGLRPFLLNGSDRSVWAVGHLKDLGQLAPASLPTVFGIWTRHIMAILVLAGIWYLLGRLRHRMVNKYGPNLSVLGILLLCGLLLAAGLEVWMKSMPGTFVFFPPMVPVVGGWMSTYMKVPETWHMANLSLFLAEFLVILSQGRVLLVEAQQGALRARMAPHFLFNTLNTLHAQIESDPSGAQQTTERLAGIFRQVQEVSEQATVPLKQELAFVEDYLGIERERLGDRLRVVVDVSDSAAIAHIPVFGLQILVENAIRHGIEPKIRGGEIRICAEVENRSVHVSVLDTGDGKGGAENGSGKALANLRARLMRPSDLNIGPISTGFRASFTYPLSR